MWTGSSTNDSQPNYIVSLVPNQHSIRLAVSSANTLPSGTEASVIQPQNNNDNDAADGLQDTQNRHKQQASQVMKSRRKQRQQKHN